MKLITLISLQILQVASWAGFGRETGCGREREEGQGEGGEGGGGGEEEGEEEEEEEGGGEGGEGEGGKELMTTFDNSVCDPTRCITTINHIYFSHLLTLLISSPNIQFLMFDLKEL